MRGRSKKIARVSKRFVLLQTTAEVRAGSARYFGKMPDNIPKKGYNQSVGRKAIDGKVVDTMDEMEEVVGMTDKQFQTTLEQILLYAEKAENKQEIIEYLQKLIEANKKA